MEERRVDMPQTSIWNRSFLRVWLCNFLIFTTFYSLIAILPAYVTDVLKGGKQQVGLAMTTFILAAVLFRPFAGKWLDELGRKKLLLAAVCLFFASTVLYLGVNSVGLLLALRFLHGASFGMGTTATGTIANDVIPEQRKGEGIGYYALSINLAMVVGPFLGLTLAAHVTFPVLFSVLAVLSLLAFLLAGLTQVPASPSRKDVERSFHWKRFVEPGAVPISIVAMFLSFAYSGPLTFVPMYAKSLGMETAASYFFVLYALVMILSRPLTGKLFDRLGANVLVYPCIVLYFFGLIGLGLAHSEALFLASGALIGLGFGTLFPAMQTIAVLASPGHRRGLATGTYLLFYDMGIGIGASVLGMAASAKGYSFMYGFAAIFVAFALLLYFRLCHHKENRRAVEEENIAA
jgi:MFS family permease